MRKLQAFMAGDSRWRAASRKIVACDQVTDRFGPNKTIVALARAKAQAGWKFRRAPRDCPRAPAKRRR